jgi:hypothetical protein
MNFRYLFFSLFGLIILFLSCDNGTVTDAGPDNGDDSGFTFDHERNPGSSAEDFLRDDDFGELVVQIQYMEGYRPEDSALDNLETFLEERLHKSSVTILTPEEIPAEGMESYSASDVRDLEEEHRTEFTEENRLTAYFIVLDGEFEEGNVLGIAHYNTSMALFGKTIADVSGGVGQPSRSVIETTVMKHEAGHVMGLVNNGVEMQESHQDEENGFHCDDNQCLMYHAVNTTDFFANLFGGDIPELDEYCIADLQAAGGR